MPLDKEQCQDDIQGIFKQVDVKRRTGVFVCIEATETENVYREAC